MGLIVTVFAGPNGSGKSTLKRSLEEAGAAFPNYLNADDYALTLTGSEEERAVSAQKWVRQSRDQMLRDRQSYSFETVMSHESHLDHIEEARNSGYTFQLIFVGLDTPKLNIYRVRERISDGGHAVPEDKITTRYHRTMYHLARALALSDRARIFDNSDAESPFVLVAKKENGRLDILVDPAPSWLTAAISKLLSDNQISELPPT